MERKIALVGFVGLVLACGEGAYGENDGGESGSESGSTEVEDETGDAGASGASAYGHGGGPVSADQQNFSIVVLPDSQSLVLDDAAAAVFTSQTQWIADNQGPDQRNIAFVLHEGDIVNDNTTEQWARADASLTLLDGVVPYALAPGNHDMGPLGKASNRDTTLFNTYFGVSRYSSLPTFGGVFPDEGTMDNSYHLFSAGGVDWLVLELEFGPRDQVLAWADTVAESFADRRIIVVTHAYMYSDDTLHGSSPSHRFNPNDLPINNLPGGVNDGQEMWDKFIRKHHNISFVFSGHIVVDGTNDDGTGQLVGVGDNGNLVYQMLANYQRDEVGERSTDGYLRIVEFERPDLGELWTVSVETYSPFLDLSRSEEDENFVFEDVDLEFRPSLNETFDGTMAGWTTVDEGGILSPSNWSVQANQAAQVSNIFGPNGQATDNRQGTFAYWDNPGAFLWDDYTATLDIRSTDDDGIGFMFRYQDPANYYKLGMDSQRGFATLFKMQGGVETTLATANNQYLTNTTMRLEVSAVGSEIRVLLDNNDLFGLIDDDGIPAGTVALYSWGNNGAYFDNVTVDEVPDLLMEEHFDGATTGGWSEIDEGGLLSPSSWGLQSDQYVQSSNIYGPNGQATANRQGTFAFWNDPAALLWDDYTCAANIRSTDNDGIGLMFRYQDQDNYYKVEMDSQRGFATLFKMQGGVETTLATDNNHQYAIGSIMRLEVSAVGSEITVLLDGQELFDPVTDADYLPVGTVALYSWGNAGAYFDDVVVQAAETP